MRGCQRQQKTWRLLIAAVCALLFVSLFACSSPESPVSPEPERPAPVTRPSQVEPLLPDDPVYVRGLPGDRTDRIMVGVNDPNDFNLNPFASGVRLFPVDPSGFHQPVYQTLFIFDPSQLVYRSVLAESLELSDQKLTIALQDEILWHDGYSLEAQDVLFTIDAHRKFDTDRGKVFARCIAEIRADGNHALDISFRENEKNAGWYVLDALAHTPIVARHVWEPAVAEASDTDSLLNRPTRIVGTGPWKFFQEDAASISFNRHHDDDGKPSYLTILKYAQTSFAACAMDNSELDLLIGEHGSDAEKLSEDNRMPGERGTADLHRIYSGQALGGLAINYGSRPELGRRSFRHFLVAIADLEKTSALWSEYPIGTERRDVLTIPSVMENLNKNALDSVFGEVSRDVMSALIEEAGMTRHPGEKVCLDGVPLEPMTLVYPDHSDHIALACFEYAKMAEKQGLTIHTKPVTAREWHAKLASGDYELAYMESSLNETFVETVERIAKIPSSLDGKMVAGKEFDVGRARDVLDTLPVGHTRPDITTCYQGLAEWMLREWLFVPLGAGYREVAQENKSVHNSMPLDTLFVFPVLTQERPPTE